MTDLDDIVPTPRLAALAQAVAALMPVVRALGEGLDQVPPVVKHDGSPVTFADYAVQALLVHALRRIAPEAGFICEESRAGLLEAGRPDVVARYVRAVREATGVADDAAALQLLDPAPPQGDDWWLIDPIDGTAGFIAGAHFSVCVARVTAGRAVLGAVGCPRLAAAGAVSVAPRGPGTVVAAELGGGAWVLDETAGRLRRTHRGAWHAPLRWARSMNRRALPVRAQPAFHALGVPLESIHIDSQCKYALIAAGRADVAVRLPGRRGPEHAWDHVAGTLLTSEAGVVATDIAGRPLDARYGADLEANRGVLCAPHELHARLVEALGPIAADAHA